MSGSTLFLNAFLHNEATWERFLERDEEWGFYKELKYRVSTKLEDTRLKGHLGRQACLPDVSTLSSLSAPPTSGSSCMHPTSLVHTL